MRKTIIVLGLICLVLNVGIGLLTSRYHTFNIVLNSGIIVATTLLMWLATAMDLRKGFEVSLQFIFALIGLVQLVLGSISAGQVSDNWCIIAIFLLLALEVIILVITKSVSKFVNK